MYKYPRPNPRSSNSAWPKQIILELNLEAGRRRQSSGLSRRGHNAYIVPLVRAR
jgi:hypothetical protein